MTIIVPPSRALSLRLLSRAATYSTQPLLRVPSDRNASPPQSASCSNASPGLFSALRVRAYATATPVTRAGRPKAHTGRASASKTKAATTAAVTITGARNTTAKKPGPKKPGPKKGASKATPKRKLKAKAKAKPKPKRKVLTEKQKVAREKKLASLKKKQLRETALLNPPKRLPDTAYQVVSIENFTKGTGVAENAKAAAAKYKSLEPEDREVSPFPLTTVVASMAHPSSTRIMSPTKTKPKTRLLIRGGSQHLRHYKSRTRIMPGLH